MHSAGPTRHVVLAAALFALLTALLLTPRIRQDPSYHQFADQRTIWGIPNALNVLSNLPFALVGLAGLLATFRRRGGFAQPWERWPYAALFGGTALTALGSSYYHLAPDNARLVWDRLPMTVGFMGFLAATVAERIGVRPARLLFVPALLLGAGSVGYWYLTELRGVGDLRPYGLVQFGSLLAIAILLARYRPRYTHTPLIVAGLAAYGLAKVLEFGDRAIFSARGIISGHSLKHLAAAAGVAFVVAALLCRRPLGDDHSPTIKYS